MASTLPDLTGPQLIEEFRRNGALLKKFVQGAANEVVILPNGTFPTIAKMVEDSRSNLINALSRQDVELLIQKIDEVAESNIVLSVYYGDVPITSGTTVIPLDNVLPVASKGTLVWSKTLTPKRADTAMIIGFDSMVDASFSTGLFSTPRDIVISVFRDNVFVGFGQVRVDSPGSVRQLSLRLRDLPKTTKPVTYTCRVGISNTGTWVLGRSIGATMGGINQVAWTITEVAP